MMNEREVSEALAQVREMQTLVLDRQRFMGFSGVARMAGGVAVLLAALILLYAVPPILRDHFIGWGIVLILGVVVNFSSLAYWLLRNHRRLGVAEIWVVAEVVPALAVGAALSFALIRAGQVNLLFGSWMALYGLAHLLYRRNLPFSVYCLGLAYGVAGVFCLLWTGVCFTDPRPMGFVFGLGELFGGLCFSLLKEKGMRPQTDESLAIRDEY